MSPELLRGDTRYTEEEEERSPADSISTNTWKHPKPRHQRGPVTCRSGGDITPIDPFLMWMFEGLLKVRASRTLMYFPLID